MKVKRSRGLSLLLILAMLCTTLFVGSAFSASAEIYFGDVDKDKSVTPTDALYVLQYQVELKTLEADELKRADVNADNKVDTTDALQILQYTVDIIDSFKAEDSGLVSIPWSPDSMAYAQKREQKEVGDIRTTFQQAGGYSATDDVQSDSTMVYIGTLAGAESMFKSWKENKQNCAQESLDIMTAVGRDNGVEYFNMYPERKDYDACKRSDGSILYHGGGSTVPYMVPTRYYAEYKIKLIDTLCKLGPGFVAVEEPESFIGAEYSEGFQEEWKDFYGTDFVDPASSAEARYMSSKLMTHLWMTMMEKIGAYMEENYPDVKLVVATHSTVNYTNWSIVSAVNAFTSCEYVDGIIGQTWSDTTYSGIPYGGGNASRAFESAFIEYASYPDSMQEGQMLFTLTDAKADNPNLTWDVYRELWEKTLVAELLQQDIHTFQECVWPSRGFTVAPEKYRTVQMAVFNALGEIGGLESTLYAGTPGISFALDDSISWQNGHQMVGNNIAGYSGIMLSLVERGIPATVTSLRYLDSVEDLAGVKVLILCYDTVKPQSEKVNEVIAQWVKQGGTLLYIGGKNDYDNINTEWWFAKNQTPYENLLQHLGLTDVQTGDMEFAVDAYQWAGPAGYGDSFNNPDAIFPNNAIEYTNIYTGSGFNPILTIDDKTFGFESEVGDGHIVSVGLPSSYFAANVEGPDQIRDLVEYATTFTDVSYTETDMMLVQRGNYIAAEAMDHSEGETLTGKFIDLLDPDLPIITTKEIEPGRSAFLYDISKLEADHPVLAYTGGVHKSEVVETADTTTFSLGGPSNATSATRLLGNGKYPQKIEATVDGNRVGYLVSLWDNETSSLLIRIPHEAPDKVDITVTWGTTAVADTEDYRWQAASYATGSKNSDEDYLLRCTGKTVTSYRQSEYDTEIVYQFDMDTLGNAFLDFNVFGNYLIQVSTDDQTYTTVYDYREISDVYVGNMQNRTVLSIFPDEHNATSGDFYVRIANTDPLKEYGGGITKLTINTKVPVTAEE